MSETTLLPGVSNSDLKRFAICWLNSGRSDCNWDKAAAMHDPKVQVASFKTVTGKAITKAIKALEEGGATFDAATKKAAAAGGKKRKAADEVGEEAPKKKGKGGGGRKKKATPEEKVDEAEEADGDAPIEGEEDEKGGIVA